MKFEERFTWVGNPYSYNPYTDNSSQEALSHWATFMCSACGKEILVHDKQKGTMIVIAKPNHVVDHQYPTPEEIKEALEYIRPCLLEQCADQPTQGEVTQ